MLEQNWNNRLTLTFNGSEELGQRGDILHNLRLRKDGSFAQRGDPDRNDWNVHWVNPDAGEARTPDKMIVNILKAKYSDKLAEFNAKQLRQRHPDRCITMEQWYQDQKISNKLGGSEKRGSDEFLLQFGDMVDACPYVYKTNSAGQPIDEKGQVIEPWETDKKRVPVLDKNGKPIKSIRYYKLVPMIEQTIRKIAAENPEMTIVTYSLHCDEQTIHAHVTTIGAATQKKMFGVSISKTAMCTDFCKRLGLQFDNGKRTQCSWKPWTEWNRESIKRYMNNELGLVWVDGECHGKKHKSTKRFKSEKDRRVNEARKSIQKERAAIKKERELLAAQQRVCDARENALAQRELDLMGAEMLEAELKEKIAEVDKKRQELDEREEQQDYVERQLEAWQDDLMALNDKVSNQQYLNKRKETQARLKQEREAELEAKQKQQCPRPLTSKQPPVKQRERPIPNSTEQAYEVVVGKQKLCAKQASMLR